MYEHLVIISITRPNRPTDPLSSVCVGERLSIDSNVQYTDILTESSRCSAVQCSHMCVALRAGGLSPSSARSMARYSCAESDTLLNSRASQLLSSTQHLLNELRSTCGSLARQAESIELECGIGIPGSSGPSPGQSPFLAPFGMGLSLTGMGGVGGRGGGGRGGGGGGGRGAPDLAQELALLGTTASGMQLQLLGGPGTGTASVSGASAASVAGSHAGSQARLSTASASGLGSQRGLAGSRGQLMLPGQLPSWPASPSRATCPGGGGVLGSLPSLIEHTDVDADADADGEVDVDEEDEPVADSEKAATIRRRTGTTTSVSKAVRMSQCSTSTLRRDSSDEHFTQTEPSTSPQSTSLLQPAPPRQLQSEQQRRHEESQNSVPADVTLRSKPAISVTVAECAIQTEATAAGGSCNPLATASMPCTPRHSRPISTLSFEVELVPKPMLDELRAQINALMVREKHLTKH